MAKRMRQRRVSSDSVQGTGSYVLVRSITMGEARELERVGNLTYIPDPELTDEENETLQTTFNEDRERQSQTLLARYIVEWDWVDDDGNPLAQPPEDPTVFDQITNLEIEFLQKALRGVSETEKKPQKKR